MRDQTRCTDLSARSAVTLLLLPVAIALQTPAMAAAMNASGERKLPSEPGAVLAQDAGSAGGTVGKQDKSATGGQDDDNGKPARGKKSVTKPRKGQDADDTTRSASRGKAGSSGVDSGSAMAFEGTWGGVSTGPCIIPWSWTINVNNGVVSGHNVTGQVTRGGTITGSMVVFSSKYDFVGQMGASQASGTWIRGGSSGCSGHWTAGRP